MSVLTAACSVVDVVNPVRSVDVKGAAVGAFVTTEIEVKDTAVVRESDVKVGNKPGRGPLYAAETAPVGNVATAAPRADDDVTKADTAAAVPACQTRTAAVHVEG